MITYKARYR